MTVDDEEIDQAILLLRRRFEDIESFGLWMNQQGLDERSLFEAVRVGMLTNRVMAILVKDIHVTEAEVQHYFHNSQEELGSGEEVRLRIILVRKEQQAEEILQKLQDGTSFNQIAYAQSLGMRAAQGGDTGWVNLRTLPTMLAEAVSLMEAGDVAGPLQKADDEFLLVGLEERRPLPMTTLAAARPLIEKRLLAVKQQAAILSWLEEQEEAAEIEIFLQDEQGATNESR